MTGRLCRLLPLVALAGCQIMLWSWPAGEPVPNVLGAWSGTWAITPPLPVRVMITDQDGTRVSGVVTYEPPSGATSTGLTGEFGFRKDGDAKRVVRPGEFGRVEPAFDVGDLRGGEGDDFDLRVVPVDEVEVVEVASGRAQDEDAFSAHR